MSSLGATLAPLDFCSCFFFRFYIIYLQIDVSDVRAHTLFLLLLLSLLFSSMSTIRADENSMENSVVKFQWKMQSLNEDIFWHKGAKVFLTSQTDRLRRTHGRSHRTKNRFAVINMWNMCRCVCTYVQILIDKVDLIELNLIQIVAPT